MTRKNRIFQILREGKELLETGISSVRHQAEVRERLDFESKLVAGHEKVKTSLEYQPQKCKGRQKLRFPIWGGLWIGVSHQVWTFEDKTSKQTR